MSGRKLDLYAAGMGYNMHDYGVTGEQAVVKYRQLHPLIAGVYEGEKDGRHRFSGGLWYDLNQAVCTAISEYRKTYAGRCSFHMERGNLICTLPSGRRLVYRQATMADVTNKVPWTVPPGKKVHAASYVSARFGPKYLYGGSITENIVQAIARDILAAVIVRLEALGIRVLLHVHDEVVASIVAELYEQFMCAVSTAPDWLTNFPLDWEGGLSPRYSKSPPPGTKEQVWRNGKFHKGA